MKYYYAYIPQKDLYPNFWNFLQLIDNDKQPNLKTAQQCEETIHKVRYIANKHMKTGLSHHLLSEKCQLKP